MIGIPDHAHPHLDTRKAARQAVGHAAYAGRFFLSR
jgi:hypothetical protein